MTLISTIQNINHSAKQKDKPLSLAVVKAAHDEVIESLREAINEGMVYAVLIDNKEALQKLIQKYQLPENSYEIVAEDSDEAASKLAVEMVKNGKANAIMKGHLSTGKLLKAVVDKEHGIRRSPLLSHVAVLYMPTLYRLVGFTDGGMVLEPSKEEMSIIIDHAVEVMHSLNQVKPKVALLSATENVIPKLASSKIEFDVVQENQREDCIIEGPLSLDISLSPAIALDKGYSGAIQGDADIIVTPDIVSGNAVSKSLTLFGGAQMAGLIIGAQVPIILTSRSSSSEEKYASILLAKMMKSE